MTRVDGLYLPCPYRKYLRHFLAFWWLLGLLCGIVPVRYAGFPGFLLMRSLALAPVSIVGLFSNLLIPFLFSLFTIRSMPWWIMVLAFWEGFGLSILAMELRFAAWPVRWLLMFGSSVFAECAYFLWLRLLSGQRVIGAACGVFLTAALAFAAEYYIISPFLASLIIH